MRPAVGLLLFYKEKSEENENTVLFWDGNRFIYYPIMSCFVFSFKKKIQRDVPEKYASNKGE